MVLTLPFVADNVGVVSVFPSELTDVLPFIVVVPLLTNGLENRWVSQQVEPEVLGWYVIKDAGPYRPAATICHTISGNGIRRFLTMFVILEPGEEPPIKRVKQLSDKSAEVAFADGRVMTIAMEREQLNYSFAK